MTVAATKTIVVVVAVPRTKERMSDAIVREERSMEMPPEADDGCESRQARVAINSQNSLVPGGCGRYADRLQPVNEGSTPTFSHSHPRANSGPPVAHPCTQSTDFSWDVVGVGGEYGDA